MGDSALGDKGKPLTGLCSEHPFVQAEVEKNSKCLYYSNLLLSHYLVLLICIGEENLQ